MKKYILAAIFVFVATHTWAAGSVYFQIDGGLTDVQKAAIQSATFTATSQNPEEVIGEALGGAGAANPMKRTLTLDSAQIGALGAALYKIAFPPEVDPLRTLSMGASVEYRRELFQTDCLSESDSSSQLLSYEDLNKAIDELQCWCISIAPLSDEDSMSFHGFPGTLSVQIKQLLNADIAIAGPVDLPAAVAVWH